MKVLYIIITFILLILGVTSYIFDITKSKQKILGGQCDIQGNIKKWNKKLCGNQKQSTCKCIQRIGPPIMGRLTCPKFKCSNNCHESDEQCGNYVKPDKPPDKPDKPDNPDNPKPVNPPNPKPVNPKHSPTPTPHSTHTRASHFFNEKVKKIISISLAVLCLSHLIISIVQFSNAGVDGVKNGLNPFGKSPPWFLSFIIITLLSVITIWNAINMFITSDQITAVL